MGRRARKRRLAPGEPRPEPSAAPVEPRRQAPATSRRARMDEAPKAPWSPFPLVELCIFIGLVLLVVGFATKHALFVLCGVGLVGIASLELAIREHFTGYRSHSSLLALAAAVATMAVLGIAIGVDRLAAVIAGAVVFVSAFLALRTAFRRRTGLAFRA